MLSFAVIALAAASAATSPTLVSTSPWWERITVTYDGDGTQRRCMHETSFSAGKPELCEVEEASASASKPAAGATAAVHTKITFERRFTPGAMPNFEGLRPGDTLLGGHVMMVAISADGAVRGCSVIASSGEDKPDYGCEEVRAERFQASAGGAARDSQVGFLAVLIYGHEEEIA